MKKLGRIYLIVTGILFVPFMWVVIQTFKPVRNVQPEDVMKIEGIVTKIGEGPGRDIVITLKDDQHYYYINRGLQQQLTISTLREQLLNQKITLHVIRRWTIFTQDHNMGHIATLSVRNRILYNEIDQNL